jgi:tetratricopeptide (TPR) repeat protein
MILRFVGRQKEAIPLFEEALRLNPKPPNVYLHNYGATLRDSGLYDAAIVQAKKATEKKPNDLLAHVVLTSCYSQAGREEEAREAAKEVLRLNPKFSVAQMQRTIPYKNRENAKRFGDSLRKAGLPD